MACDILHWLGPEVAIPYDTCNEDFLYSCRVPVELLHQLQKNNKKILALIDFCCRPIPKDIDWHQYDLVVGILFEELISPSDVHSFIEYMNTKQYPLEQIGCITYKSLTHKDIPISFQLQLPYEDRYRYMLDFQVDNRQAKYDWLCLIGQPHLHRINVVQDIRHHENILKSFASHLDEDDPALQGEKPIKIDQGRSHCTHPSNIELYNQCRAELVVETAYWGCDYSPWLTEKTWRAVLYGMPFVVVGQKHTLKYLHSLGFKTYSDLWSEDYDNLNDQQRWSAILELINQPLAIDPEVVEQILLHNLQNYVTITNNMEAQRIQTLWNTIK